MNIITADFNWISLLIIIVATVIGIVKSHSKKTVYPTDFINPEEEGAENEEERYISPEYQQRGVSSEENIISGDYIREPAKSRDTAENKKESPIYQMPDEEKEEHLSFDIRQAIISSEILRRPEF